MYYCDTHDIIYIDKETDISSNFKFTFPAGEADLLTNATDQEYRHRRQEYRPCNATGGHKMKQLQRGFQTETKDS